MGDKACGAENATAKGVDFGKSSLHDKCESASHIVFNMYLRKHNEEHRPNLLNGGVVNYKEAYSLLLYVSCKNIGHHLFHHLLLFMRKRYCKSNLKTSGFGDSSIMKYQYVALSKKLLRHTFTSSNDDRSSLQ